MKGHEIVFEESPVDHEDDRLNVEVRRRISGYTPDPVDFYEAEYNQIITRLGRGPLRYLDVGCNSGQALQETIASRLPGVFVGLDPLVAPYQEYIKTLGGSADFFFVQGVGENLPFQDGVFDVVSANNVVIRARDRNRMLSEIARVTRVGGLDFITTNDSDHASYRHHGEFLGSIVLSRKLRERGELIQPLRPPAHGNFACDIENALRNIPGLKIIDTLRQDSYTEIDTAAKFTDYVLALMLSANRIPYLVKNPDKRAVWREIMKLKVLPTVVRSMQRRGYFKDPIHRVMFAVTKKEI